MEGSLRDARQGKVPPRLAVEAPLEMAVDAVKVADERGGRLAFTVSDCDVQVSEKKGGKITGLVRGAFGGGVEIHDRREGRMDVWYIDAETLWNAFTKSRDGRA